MRVICINSKLNHGEYPGVMPQEGVEYTVIQTITGYDMFGVGTKCYELEEIPQSIEENNLYDIGRFIQLSELDETEIHKETELVTIEDNVL